MAPRGTETPGGGGGGEVGEGGCAAGERAFAAALYAQRGGGFGEPEAGQAWGGGVPPCARGPRHSQAPCGVRPTRREG